MTEWSPRVVVGVDASLTGTGVAVLPAHWWPDWRAVTTARFGVRLAADADVVARSMRCRTIAEWVVEQLPREAEHVLVAIEAYAFGQAHRAHQLGELGGVLRAKLLACGYHNLVEVPATSARKTLLCKVPRSSPKDAVKAALVAAGAPGGLSADEYDALCVGNHAAVMADVGGLVGGEK